MQSQVVNALRAMTAVSIGALAVVGGAFAVSLGAANATSADCSKEALNIALIAGGAASNIGAGLIGGACHNGIKEGFASVSQRLIAAADKGRLPRNHDILRGLRRSHLNALQYLVARQATAARREFSEYNLTAIKKFSKEADRWIEDQLKLSSTEDFLMGAPFTAVEQEFRILVDTSSVEQAPGLLGAIGEQASNAAWAEFIAAVPSTPMSFKDWFFGNNDQNVGWLAATHGFFAEKLKTDVRLRTAVFGERLSSIQEHVASIDVGLAAISDAIARRDTDLNIRLDRLERAIAAYTRSPADELETLLSGLSARIATLPDSAVMESKLDAILAALAPEDTWVAYRAAFQSRSRHLELRERFFGRNEELTFLNHEVENETSSITLVTAGAGAGKSALLAAWCDLRRSLGDTVVQHMIAQRFPATINTIGALQHLAQQLAILDCTDGSIGQNQVPETETGLLDMLAKRLAQDEQAGSRLLLVVDGLDELVGVWTDRFVTSLGRNVHVVLSCRASGTLLPPPLARWSESFERSSPQSRRPSRLILTPLSLLDTRLWLEEIAGPLGRDESEIMAKAIRKVTDGLPVFIDLVLDDLRINYPLLPTRVERVAFVTKMPASILDYAAQALEQLQADLSDRASQIEALFAILCQAREPLDGVAIVAIFKQSKLEERFGVLAPVSLAALDHRIRRWLDKKGSGSAATLVFSHPRIAFVFAQALGDVAAAANQAVSDWAKQSLQAGRSSGFGLAQFYALRHLPSHLLTAGDRVDSERLLRDEAFVTKRLEQLGIPETVERMASDWRAWGVTNTHARFWRNAGSWVNSLPTHGPIGVEAVRTLLADLGLCGECSRLPAPRTDLVPSALATLSGHQDWVKGALELSDGQIISWGSDATIRGWSAEGETTSVFLGHKDSIDSVIELPNSRVLSVSNDETMRIWTTDGKEVATLKGHEDGFDDALLLSGSRILSWGSDNALLVWNLDGESIATLAGHQAPVIGALELPTGNILSWSYDKTLRIWGADGKLISILDGHTKSISGAVLLPGGRILSWSSDATLRTWSDDGETLLATLEGHSEEVEGVQVHESGRILSWSRDNTLRIWESDGRPFSRMIGHEDNINGALWISPDRILSWSADATLRIWREDGETIATLEGHQAWVADAKLLPSGRILSWADDSSLRLWNSDGVSLAELEGHFGYINGAMVLPGEQILSWSDDGDLRLWGSRGDLTSVLSGHTGAVWGVIQLTSKRLLSWSDDNTLRMWSLEGASRPSFDLNQKLVNAQIEATESCLSSSSYSSEPLRLIPTYHHVAQLEGPAGLEGILWLPNGRYLTWQSSRNLQLRSDHLGLIATLEGHQDWVTGALAMPGGSILSWSADGTLRLWDEVGNAVTQLEGHGGAITSALVLPNSSILSWSIDACLRLWDLTGAPITTMGGHSQLVGGARLLSDSRILSWSNDQTLRIWRSNGEQIAEMTGHFGPVTGALESENGEIFSLSQDHTLRRWSTNGEPLAGFLGHTDTINGVIMLPRSRVLTWSSDTTMRIWSYDGSLTWLWLSPAGPIESVSVLPDGRARVSNSGEILLVTLPQD
jgi:hypothetical protein